MSGPWMTLTAVALWGALHSTLASPPLKAFVHDRLGPRADRWYRVMYNISAGLTFLPVLAVLALDPGKLLYRAPWPWAALLVLGQLGAGMLLVVGLLHTDVWHFIGLRQFGEAQDSQRQLVVTGLYRWVRHPLYTAGLLFLWLTPLMTSSLLALNIGLTAYILIGLRFEERRLVSEFGMAYEAYRRRVPALLPFPRPATPAERP
jgi:protein-S-isoprenylcysteine O-methyltransferase Ste14